MIRNLVLPAAAATLLGLPLAGPAAADATLGIGFGLAFGAGQVDVGAGLRVFSDDRRDRAAGSVGFDYMFTSGRLRPSLGIAYLYRNGFVGVDLGFDTRRGGPDFGLGAGYADTR